MILTQKTSICKNGGFLASRVEKQDNVLKAEFQKRIQAKIAAEKGAVKYRIDKAVPSFLALVFKHVSGAVFRIDRGVDKFKEYWRSKRSIKLRIGLSKEWLLMNNVIVEPESDELA